MTSKLEIAIDKGTFSENDANSEYKKDFIALFGWLDIRRIGLSIG